MSLVKCLGPIRLPRAYTQFMRSDLNNWKKAQANNTFGQWQQYPLETTEETDWRSNLVMPARDDGSFRKKLSEISSGNQFHSIMSLVSCAEHNDVEDEFKSKTLLIPYRVSHCHFLEVEGERHTLKPMHVYAFNQKRYHRLGYAVRTVGGPEEIESSRSKVASFLHVGFFKKGISR